MQCLPGSPTGPRVLVAHLLQHTGPGASDGVRHHGPSDDSWRRRPGQPDRAQLEVGAPTTSGSSLRGRRSTGPIRR